MRALRIAVLKPDFGVIGGFEAVADRVETALRSDGHLVNRVAIPMGMVGVPGSGTDADATHESRLYAQASRAFAEIDSRRFDVVLSTQPPSFAHRHPRHLSLFFHHQRVHYDLEELWIEAGMVDDPAAHREASAQVRALDAPALSAVTWFAAGSETVRRRLGRFNGIDRVSLFHAGSSVGSSSAAAAPQGRRDGPVLCVGRLELPKRPELFVTAMRRLPHVPATLVGSGGRLDWVRALDHRLATTADELGPDEERAQWCCRPAPDVAAPDGWRSSIAMPGRVDDATLTRLYATAPCVVAPALDEDYGLTAIEAMAHGAPVIVCDDGGGLVDLVDHEVDGLVAAPDGASIAAAVERIVTDRDLAGHLAEGARRRAAATTWDRAHDELRLALQLMLDEAEAPTTEVGAP